MLSLAAVQAPPAGGRTGTVLMIYMVAFAFIMWFLIIRPQQRRAKEHQELIRNVRRGDTIVTAGGFIGKVTKVADEAAEIEVEIAEGVRVKVVRAMISEVRSKGEPVKA
jgi:preprotein translocase subunit YajC